ncbi:unnamed protein product [Closterium sp. Naga37s-1]|nr:unnamed protein product [Closterium sp. Naga37s-1]
MGCPLHSLRALKLVGTRIAARVSSPLLHRSFAALSPSARASSQSWDGLSQPTGEWQSTLKAPVTVSGVGLHLGLPTTVTLLPAPAASGRVFHVVHGGDGGGGEGDGGGGGEGGRVAGAGRKGGVVEIDADVWSVVDTRLSTVLAAAAAAPSGSPSSHEESPAGGGSEHGEVRLGTVEHLLSALEGFGVDNCVIRVEGAGEVR